MFIGSLIELRHPDLSDNWFDGTIRNTIGNLTKLRYLDISYNNLQGLDPFELGNLTNLYHLGLASLRSVKNLGWLSHLSLLQHLDMWVTPLTEPSNWIDMILRLPNLSYLCLSNCNLSQAMIPCPSLVNSSMSISDLDLSYNYLTSSAYYWLLPLMTNNSPVHLDLSGNWLDGIPRYFGNCCSLKSLYIEGNQVDASFSDLLTNLSGCATVNLEKLNVANSQFTGSVPSEIQNFVSLKMLLLSNNQLRGTISEKLWELPKLEILSVSSNSLTGIIPIEFGKSKLWYINLSKNSLQGVLSEVHMQNISKLKHLDLSFNSLSFELQSIWVPPFQLDYIDLSSFRLGPQFPNWIQTQKNLRYLNIANSSIADVVSMGFWDAWSSQLEFLNLSFKDMTGILPDLSSSFARSSTMDLSSNKFYGLIPKFPSNLLALNLSKNKFYGGLSFLCQIVDGLLSFLDLSHNSLTGQIPDCLSHFRKLRILNLGDNNLSRMIPKSVGSLIQLKVLYLCSNDLSRKLPLLLKNCTMMEFLCLGGNRFSGNVPAWIGENFTQLYALILGSNNFLGPIPVELCKLRHLQILDLSKNRVGGTIPPCLINVTVMVKKRFPPVQTQHFYLTKDSLSSPEGFRFYSRLKNYVDYTMIVWQGVVREFRSKNLGYVKSIDLSSNNLAGWIPDELTSLYELVSLNLSNNDLDGEIPRKISELKSLIVLDLSKNNLSGVIPSSMSLMTSLSHLDVSDNNLYGRIPSGTQLQSMDASRYTGNEGLCGPPLTQKCPGDVTQELPDRIFEYVNGEEGADGSLRWYYIGWATGFPTGFWVACGVLLVNRRGRHAFFRFYNHIMDWIYLSMALILVQLQRAVET